MKDLIQTIALAFLGTCLLLFTGCDAVNHNDKEEQNLETLSLDLSPFTQRMINGVMEDCKTTLQTIELRIFDGFENVLFDTVNALSSGVSNHTFEDLEIDNGKITIRVAVYGTGSEPLIFGIMDTLITSDDFDIEITPEIIGPILQVCPGEISMTAGLDNGIYFLRGVGTLQNIGVGQANWSYSSQCAGCDPQFRESLRIGIPGPPPFMEPGESGEFQIFSEKRTLAQDTARVYFRVSQDSFAIDVIR